MKHILQHFLSVVFVCFFGIFATTDAAIAGKIYLTYEGNRVPDDATFIEQSEVHADCEEYYGNWITGLSTYYNMIVPGTNGQDSICTSTNCAGSGANNSTNNAHHIQSCGGWGTSVDCRTENGHTYTRRAVKRVTNYDSNTGKYTTSWRYECRCGPNEYEYFANNPTGDHADTDMNFVCKECGSDEIATCGYPDPLTNAYSTDPTYSCNGVGTLVNDASGGLRCECTDIDNNGTTEGVYVYASRSGKKFCNLCKDTKTTVATCGNGSFVCKGGYIRSRQDGTVENTALSYYPGYTAYYPDDSGYACNYCNVCEKGDYKDLYTGEVHDDLMSYHGVQCSWLDFMADGVVPNYSASYSENTCERQVTRTDATDNRPDVTTGAMCDAVQTFNIVNLKMDDDYAENKRKLDVATNVYVSTTTHISKTGIDSNNVSSYVDGGNDSANTLCKKCAPGSVITVSEGEVQIGVCPALPACSTLNENNRGFHCQPGCYLASVFDNQTCYPCPMYGGDDGSNVIAWGISDGADFGWSPEGAVSPSQCEMSIDSQTKVSGFYAGGQCPVSDSNLDPSALGKGRGFTIMIASTCKRDMATCAFSGFYEDGYFPWVEGESDAEKYMKILSKFGASSDYYTTDLFTAQLLVECAKRKRTNCSAGINSGCGCDLKFQAWIGSTSGTRISL